MQKDHYTLRCQKLLNSHLLSMTSGPHLSSPSSSPFSLTRALILQGMQVQAAPARWTSPRAHPGHPRRAALRAPALAGAMPMCAPTPRTSAPATARHAATAAHALACRPGGPRRAAPALAAPPCCAPPRRTSPRPPSPCGARPSRPRHASP